MFRFGALEAFSIILPGLIACQEVDLDPRETPVVDPDGAVAGRICAPTGDGWLENAYVYTNIANSAGVISGIRETYTDRDGYFVLTGIPESDLVVIYIQKGTYHDSLETTVEKGTVTTLPTPECFDPQSLSAAVVLGEYDTFSKMLDKVGVTGYWVYDGTRADSGDGGEDSVYKTAYELFVDMNAMLGFDLICVNGGIQEPGVVDDPLVNENLAAYVEGGGFLFVTDWSYDLIERSFPEAIDFLGDDTRLDAAEQGLAEVVPDAMVVDQSLASYLGKQNVEVRYDLAYWPLIVGATGQIVVHLVGNVHFYDENAGDPLDAPGSPLLVSFSAGYGTVVFSTFREEANLSSDSAEILQYMLYKL